MTSRESIKKERHKHDAQFYINHLGEITQGFDACFVCFKDAAVRHDRKEMKKYLIIAKAIFEKINFNFAGSFRFMQKISQNFSRCSIQVVTDILAAYDVENREKIKEVESKILEAMAELLGNSKEITCKEIMEFNKKTATPFNEFIEKQKDLIQTYARCLRDANNTLTLIIESSSSPTVNSIPLDHPLNQKIQKLSDRIFSDAMIDGANPDCYMCYYEAPTHRDPKEDEDPSFLSENDSSLPFLPTCANQKNHEPIVYSDQSNSDEDPILSTDDEIYEAKRAARQARRRRQRKYNSANCCLIS